MTGRPTVGVVLLSVAVLLLVAVFAIFAIAVARGPRPFRDSPPQTPVLDRTPASDEWCAHVRSMIATYARDLDRRTPRPQSADNLDTWTRELQAHCK